MNEFAHPNPFLAAEFVHLLTSTGTEPDATVNEFLSRQIPYNQFVKIAVGQKVEIILGPKEIELNEQHLSALRQRKKCVDASRCE